MPIIQSRKLRSVSTPRPPRKVMEYTEAFGLLSLLSSQSVFSCDFDGDTVGPEHSPGERPTVIEIP